MADSILVKPTDLCIDEQNPRISHPNEGQRKALQSLAQHLQRKLLALARDIVRHGLNPSDLPIVMPSSDGTTRYTVLEGNRRLAAIRALENPEWLVDAVGIGVVKEMRRLSKRYQENPIEEVLCLAVKDPQEARHWIELRHTGENQGAGIVKWGSDDKDRFRARSGVIEIHSQALNFLERRGDLTADARRTLPVTSFKRLLGTPEVRARLGIEVREGQLCGLAREVPIAKALMHVVSDLASGKINVRNIYGKSERVKYAQKLPADVIVTPTLKSGHGVPLSGAPAPSAPGRATGGVSRLHRQRKKLIPRECVLTVTDPRLRMIENELRRLDVDEYTNAVSVLFRVFLELSVDSYLANHPLGVNQNDKLRKKIESVASDLQNRKKLNKQQGRAIRAANLEHSFLAPGVATLNDYIHNPYVFPAPGDLRAHWSSLQPFVAAMWAA